MENQSSSYYQNSIFYVILIYLVFVFSKMKHFLLEMSFSQDGKGGDD